MKAELNAPPSIPGLLRELRDQTATLLRQEVELAKTELKENTAQIGAHVARLAVGGFVAYAGVIVLLIGLGQLLGIALVRAGVSEPFARWLAPTVVGLLVAIVGAVMLASARKSLAGDGLAPRRTVETVQENKQWVERKINQSNELGN